MVCVDWWVSRYGVEEGVGVGFIDAGEYGTCKGSLG